MAFPIPVGVVDGLFEGFLDSLLHVRTLLDSSPANGVLVAGDVELLHLRLRRPVNLEGPLLFPPLLESVGDSVPEIRCAKVLEVVILLSTKLR